MSDQKTSVVNSKEHPMPRRKKPRNYINNADFYAAMVDFLEKRKKDPDYQVPAYIGKCLLQLATRYSTKPNFYGYSYRDEMISDALENCIRYIHCFDPAKSNNPFAYFTQFVKNAFILRIQQEQGMRYNMIKNTRHHLVMAGAGGYDHCLDEQVRIESDIYENNAMFLQSYEQTLARRREKAAARAALNAQNAETARGIERFYSEEENGSLP